MNDDIARDIPPGLREWLREHGEGLADAVGMWDATPDFWALLLTKTRDYVHGQFPLWKDDIGRMRCDRLTEFLSGKSLPDDELREAIGLLMQAFGAAVESNWAMKRRLDAIPKHQPRIPLPRYPPRRAR